MKKLICFLLIISAWQVMAASTSMPSLGKRKIAEARGAGKYGSGGGAPSSGSNQSSNKQQGAGSTSGGAAVSVVQTAVSPVASSASSIGAAVEGLSPDFAICDVIF